MFSLQHLCKVACVFFLYDGLSKVLQISIYLGGVFIQRIMHSFQAKALYLFRSRFMRSFYAKVYAQYLYKGSCIVFMHRFMYSIFTQKYLFSNICKNILNTSLNLAHKYSKSQSKSKCRIFTDYCARTQNVVEQCGGSFYCRYLYEDLINNFDYQ